MKEDPSKWTSRKLALSGSTIFVMIILPILYKQLEISDAVTLLVLGAIASVAGVYNFTNTIAKKYDQSSDG